MDVESLHRVAHANNGGEVGGVFMYWVTDGSGEGALIRWVVEMI